MYFVLGTSYREIAVKREIRTADPTPPTGVLSLRYLDRGADIGGCAAELGRWAMLGVDGVLQGTWF